MSVVQTLDLSQSLGAVHHQGFRNTCLAFALSDMNRHLNSARTPLSAEYLYRSAAQRMSNWKPDYGLYLAETLSAVKQPGQPTALAYPYAGVDPSEVPPNLEPLPTSPPGSDKLYSSSIRYEQVNAASVELALAQGYLVGLTLQLTQSFISVEDGVIEFSDQVINDKMCHSVIATGMGKHQATGESFIRIRNSWGDGWGDAGYAWLPFSYVDFHVVQAFKV